ncbi:MAG TPA: hypothetical protein VFF79_02740 [Conexibacter sp.]|nr:hypothetical protein [Conexibacter sp.]
MAVFFIDTDTGQVATRRQLIEAGMVAESETPARPWLRIQGSDDATTMWYAVLRKRERGIFIGALAIRHGEHHASLLQGGWDEIPLDELRRGPGPARPATGDAQAM